MGKWLECTITPGQFTGEYAIQGEMFDKSGFSLFAPKNDLRFSGEPTRDKPIKGLIRVMPRAEKDDLILVSLPRPTFENGRTITVKKTQLQKAE